MQDETECLQELCDDISSDVSATVRTHHTLPFQENNEFLFPIEIETKTDKYLIWPETFISPVLEFGKINVHWQITLSPQDVIKMLSLKENEVCSVKIPI